MASSGDGGESTSEATKNTQPMPSSLHAASSTPETERGDESSSPSSNLHAALLHGSSSGSYHPNILSIDEAIETVGSGAFQRRLFLATGLAASADATEVMLLSFLSLSLQSEWGLTSTSAANLSAIVFVGMLVGTLVLGYLGDHIGRRPTYLASCVIITAFGVATAFAPNYAGLLGIRFVVGFGVGGITVPYDIFSEFVPTAARGKYLTAMSFFWTLGSLLAPALAYLTLDYSWRLFVALCSIPALVSGLLGAWLVPESPRWLVARGEQEKALRILKEAARVNGLDPDELFPPEMVIKDEHVEATRFRDLLSPRWRKITLLLWIAWIGMEIGYYGLILLISRVFDPDANGDDTNNAGGDGDAPDFDYASILISSSSELIGVLMAMFATDRFGRVPTMISSFLFGGAFVAAFSFVAHTSIDNEVLLTALSFTARAFEMLMSSVLWMYTAEILTTEIRTTGHATASAAGRLGCVAAPYLVRTSNSFVLIGSVMLGIHFVVAVILCWFPETGGRKLGKSAMDDDDSSEVMGEGGEVRDDGDHIRHPGDGDFFEPNSTSYDLLL